MVVPFGGRAVAAKPARRSHLPLRIFRPSREVQVRLKQAVPLDLKGEEICGRVLQSAGPWRLEGEWWGEQALRRDYYQVELTDGGIYRLYVDRSRWFVDAICG